MNADPTWTTPTKQLAPGLKLAAPDAAPKIELEQVVEPDPDTLAEVQELRAQNKRLMGENKLLMEQIEAAWTVIKNRDAEIQNMRDNSHTPWAI